MQPLELTLQAVLKMSYSFQVPLYQRRYAWRAEQHTQLWNDLLIQYKWLQDGKAAAPRHFIGSIVLLPRGESPDLVTRWDLVDGQQRMTTLLILLVAIRDAMGLMEADFERFNEKYLTNEDAGGNDQWKLLPGIDDRDPLTALIDGSEVEADHAIKTTYEYFQARLTEPVDNSAIILEQMLRVVLGRVKLVRIEIESDDSVYQVFESLNATGKPLDQVDLLRSFFFSLLGDEGKQSFIKHWRYLENLLGDDLEFFLWCNLVRQGHYVSQSQIYRRQQQVIGGRSIDKKALTAELALLHKLADVYTLIDNPGKILPGKTLKRVKRLKELGLNQPAFPMVLYILERLLVSKTAKDDEASRALADLESYLVRRLIVGKQTNNLNRMLGAALEDIAKYEENEDQRAVDVTISEALSAASRYWPSDIEVRAGAKSNPFYASVRAAAQKSFVLRELIYSDTDEKPDLATLQVEHIMPATLSAEWREHLHGQPETALEIHERLRHTLGNLTLIGHKANPAMRNVGWSAKQPFYRKSNPHNRKLARNASAWREVEIEKRAKSLGDLAVTAWPGPKSTPAVPPENEVVKPADDPQAPLHII